jgi:hypothetical protein
MFDGNHTVFCLTTMLKEPGEILSMQVILRIGFLFATCSVQLRQGRTSRHSAVC